MLDYLLEPLPYLTYGGRYYFRLADGAPLSLVTQEWDALPHQLAEKLGYKLVTPAEYKALTTHEECMARAVLRKMHNRLDLPTTKRKFPAVNISMSMAAELLEEQRAHEAQYR
ncbi:MAG: hypothetical protein ACK518_00410 [bacterium]|jgi:hypothetical protein